MLCIAWELSKKGGVTLQGSVALTEYPRLILFKTKEVQFNCGSEKSKA